MSQFNRRQFLAGATATAAAVTLGAPRVHAQKKGGTIRFIPHADLKVLDPIATTAYITRNHAYLIYDTLFGTDANLAIKPQMVEKYASSNKGMKWSFTLRDGLKFHDGQPVVAEDAVESLKRWSKRDPLGRLLAAHTAKMAVVDKRTFTLDLAEPFGLVLDAIGKPSSNVPFIMPARIAATSENEPIKETIGSGPFKFVKDEWQPGNQVVYVKNADYRPRGEKPSGSTGGKVVSVDRVVWRFVGSHEARLNELLSGGADMMEDFLPPTTNLARLAERSDLRLAQFPSQTIAYLLLNQRNPRDTTGPHPILSRPAVREALALGLDQQTMIRGLMGKYAEPISGPTPGAAWYRTLAPPPIKFDPKRAQAILFQDGWRDVDGDGILERDGQPLRLGIMMPMSSTVRVQLAQVVEQQWRAIGVDVDVQPVEGPVFRASRLGGRFDITVESYSIDPSPWGLVDLFGCTGANNLARYCNAAADSLLSRAHWSQENPNADLRRYFSMLVADHPAIFLYGREFALPIPKLSRNPDFHPESPYLMVWTWNRSGR